jgi:hypothetical protein
MSLFGALSDAFGGFFLSAAKDRARYQARHPNRAVYARPIVRQYQPWPGTSQRPQHQLWPHERWPGERR